MLRFLTEVEDQRLEMLCMAQHIQQLQQQLQEQQKNYKEAKTTQQLKNVYDSTKAFQKELNTCVFSLGLKPYLEAIQKQAKTLSDSASTKLSKERSNVTRHRLQNI